MAQFGWQTAPADVSLQVQSYVSGILDLFQSQLHGVYLTGSLATGCFNPVCSDIDVLTVVSGINADQYNPLITLTLDLSRQPYPIETTVFRKTRTWLYPPPFEFHFSESHRSTMVAYRKGAGSRRRHAGFDADLAIEIESTRQRGVCLYGPPASGLLPEIPHRDIVDAMRRDMDWAWERANVDYIYPVLNGCRAYVATHQSLLTSKEEAGTWGIANLPSKFKNLIESALQSYRGISNESADPQSLKDFEAFLRSRLAAQSDSVGENKEAGQ